jgi:restriction system protein
LLAALVRPDALGLDLVGVQAKRYDKEDTVQRPDIQAFVDALQGAPRRVAACSSQPGGSRRVPGNLPKTLPCDFASSTATELTKLVVRYNVGVQVRETFELKQIDEEEFAE